ncbi:helix-turn-helix transcriptional regulator [Magnetovibrio sp. PR-2]|uniref:helix-turn-helix domain-containing protein n=1 Tax=Magnetovibrio sp. PR-2 TaxID=3120356 RepID=UPI002FCE02A2
MNAASDSTASMASQVDADETQDGASGHFPVFEAFDELGLTGRDVAELASVTPPTVSKWRKAKVKIPGEKLAFVTLVLAHLLDEVEQRNADTGVTKGAVMNARAALLYQDVLNKDLHPAQVRDGAQLFRTWWASGQAAKLQDKRFRPRDGAQILETLKRTRQFGG